MAKKIKSLICPQCNATEAEKISDSTYKCRYCGAIFMVDDDNVGSNVTINNINNINVNVTQNNSTHYYNSKNRHYASSNKFSWMDKKTKILLLGFCGFFFTMVCILSHFSSPSTNKTIDPKQKSTLSENLYDKENVFYSYPFVYHDSAAFFTLTKEYSTSEDGHLVIVMADDLSTKIINTPSAIDLSGKSIDSELLIHHLILGKDKKIYKLNLETLDFYNFTDSIFNLNQDLKSSTILRVSHKYNGFGFVFVTDNGREYTYSPSTHEIIDEQSVTTNNKKVDIPSNKKSTNATYYALCGYNHYQGQDLYKIIINDKGFETQQKWKEKIVFYKSSKRTPKQINPDIISITCVKKLGLHQAKIIYTTDKYIYMVYEVKGINFMRKTDLSGEEIWTKKIAYEFKPDEDSYSGISGERYVEYGSSLIFKKYEFNYGEKIPIYMIIDKDDNIKFVKERWIWK